MCNESATADDIHAAMPRPVVGNAADPIALEPVDDVVVTTLVGNDYDALLTGDNTITRAPLAAIRWCGPVAASPCPAVGPTTGQHSANVR